ncbi:MAG: tRNA lysidine(34) synthetase TilS [Chloroflexales bacterium]|nr:tRNA lysidine(34) synthetase TilS [Chloroflexales bacterium]
MTDFLIDRVRSFLGQQHLWRNNALIVVAVSGGPDSLCLLHLLWRLRTEGGPAIHIAHLDHSFRGEQSAAEAKFVKKIAASWEITSSIERCDVPRFADERGLSPQAAARVVRYAFLARTVQAHEAAAVAVAHHADDQAETVLLHLLHGAGLAGLRGMRAVVPWDEWHNNRERAPAIYDVSDQNTSARSRSPMLLRPLLDTTRAEIEDYCASHALHPCYDLSNSSVYYLRNRIRAELLPFLTTYNPRITDALRRTAQICADDYAYLQAQLDTYWPALAFMRQGAINFHLDKWTTLPVALQRYALRRAALLLTGADALSYDQIEAGRTAAAQGQGQRLSLGLGLSLHVTDQHLLVINPSEYRPEAITIATEAAPQLNTSEVILKIPGTTSFADCWQAETSFIEPKELPAGNPYRWWTVLDYDTLNEPLILRRRRSRDRFRPAGGRGSRLLQDFFVDQKVPRELRADWPILATLKSVVWIAGLRTDDRFQATTQTRRPLWVQLIQQ